MGFFEQRETRWIKKLLRKSDLSFVMLFVNELLSIKSTDFNIFFFFKKNVFSVYLFFLE